MNRTGLIWVAAVLGGFGAVAAEVVFTRRMSLLFGVTAPAAATVVAVYMAGMALGSGFGGRLADTRRAARVYAGAEGFGLLWCLLFLPLATLFEGFGWGVVSIGTALLVGPAAFASGMTFPALSKALGHEGEVRRLLAANTLGAAAGALAAGLWLPSLIGFRMTLALAAACLGLAAVAVLVGVKTQPETVHLPPPKEPVSAREAALAYGALAALGMMAEIGWTRLLEQTGPNPGALTFPMVLAAYLVGLALGGLLLEPRLRARGERSALAACAAIAALSTAAALATLRLIPSEVLVGHYVGVGPGNAWVFEMTGVQVSADRLAIYLAAAMIPGVASGAAFPIAASAVMRAREGLGRGVGGAWAAGTVAAVVAVLWMGFLPLGGTIRSLAACALVASLVAAVLGRGPLRFVPLLVAPALLVPAWAGLQLQPREQVQTWVETAAGTSALTRTTPKGWSPEQPGDPTRGTWWVHTHGERVPGFPLELEIPLALHPDPSEVVLIAFGTGLNTKLMLEDRAVDHVSVADIDPALPGLAVDLPFIGRDLFATPRATFVHEDGRHLLRRSDPVYDVIYSDVATYAQYVELGTVEFFALARDRLAPGGIFALKIHADTLSEPGMRRFLATIAEVFPDALLFDAHGSMPVIVAFSEPPSQEAIEARIAEARSTYRVGLSERVLGMNVVRVADLAEGTPGTDDHPMALRHALFGPVDDESIERSAMAALAAGFEEHSEQAGAYLFGLPEQSDPRGRPRPPQVPPERPGWFE